MKSHAKSNSLFMKQLKTKIKGAKLPIGVE